MVSRQLHYIIAAFLLLVIVSGLLLFIRIIPVDRPPENEETITASSTQPRDPVLSGSIAHGKALFMSKCASCHLLFKDATGPDLSRIIDNDQWSDRKKLY